MPLQILHQNITKIECDAIVNPTDNYFSGSGGTDKQIHIAAGTELDKQLATLPAISVGNAVVSDAFELPCKYIIHTVGPIWQGGEEHEETLLRSCYINCLIEADKLGCESIAFPLISAGTFHFPKEKVLKIAISAIKDHYYISENEPDIYLCIFDKEAYMIADEFDLDVYLRTRTSVFERPEICYSSTTPHAPLNKSKIKPGMLSSISSLPKSSTPKEKTKEKKSTLGESLGKGFSVFQGSKNSYRSTSAQDFDSDNLADWLKHQDDTFAVTLLKLIDKRKMSDVQCYKNANVSKKTWWKIQNLEGYKPSKPTVLAFAISLKLNLEETEQLLKTVGFSLSHSNVFDMIIEFYITKEKYDIDEINAALYKYDQITLGC